MSGLQGSQKDSSGLLFAKQILLISLGTCLGGDPICCGTQTGALLVMNLWIYRHSGSMIIRLPVQIPWFAELFYCCALEKGP